MQFHFDTSEINDLDRKILSAIAEHFGGAATKPAAAAKAATKPAKVEETPASTDGPTLEDAVAAATKLVSTGQAQKVKEALASVGAKRVSELDEDAIPAFLAALDA